MAKLTLFLAVILIAIGVGSYFMTGMRSPTALIPAAMGLLFAVAGVVAMNPGGKKHAMHAAVLLAVIGIAGTISGVFKTVQLWTQGTRELNDAERAARNLKDDQVVLKNDAVIRPVAAQMQALTAAVLALYTAACVNSFIAARKARTTPKA